MKVLVLGGAGSVGKLILREALAQGHQVTALVRNSAKLADVRHDNLTVMPGDALDPRVLQRISIGFDAVIYSLGAKPGKLTTLFSDSTRVLLEVMKQNSIRRLVAITGIGAGDSKGHGGFLYDKIVYPFFTRPLYEDKDRMEQLIRDSGVEWVIVRPASFQDGPATGNIRAETELEGVTISKISRADVARFVVDQLTSDRFLRRTPLIGY